MAQQYYTQEGANASVIAEMIREMGKNVSEGMQQAMVLRLKNKEIDLQSLQKIKDFMSLPAEKRKALLQDPSFRQNIIQTLDPESFSSRKKMKNLAPEEYQKKVASALQLGEETPDEAATRRQKVAEAGKTEGESRIKTAEAILAEQKARISTGVETPTPLSLLMTGDVKDPIAAALFSTIPTRELTQIAEAQHKVGPLYQQQQMQEWYKWGIDQGMPLGVAMQVAIPISRGEWDKVPQSYTDASNGKVIPIRGAAEQRLALEALNTRAHMQEVNNNIMNSIASAAAQLAEKAGIPLDQARADVMALRDNKPAPFPTRNLEDMVNMSRIQKQQEIDKNTQTLLNDQSGIGVIKEGLTALLAEYKESGTLSGVVTGAQKSDLEDKINKLTEELSSRLAGRYGIKFDTYDANHPFAASVRGALGAVWQGGKAAGALGIDLGSDAGKLLKSEFDKVPNQSNLNLVAPEVAVSMRPASTAKFTQDQEKIMQNLIDSFNTALGSDTVPAEQKNAIKKYIESVVKPVYDDPSRFLELFKQPESNQEPQQEF